MRCKAGRTRGPADEDFELSRLYHLKRGAGGGDGSGEEEKGWRMENIQPVFTVDFCLFFPAFPAKHVSLFGAPTATETFQISILSLIWRLFFQVCVCERVFWLLFWRKGRPRWEQNDSHLVSVCRWSHEDMTSLWPLPPPSLISYAYTYTPLIHNTVHWTPWVSWVVMVNQSMANGMLSILPWTW